MVWNMKFIKYRENKLIVTKYVQNVCHWHEHKLASAFATGQWRHQSATAPSRAAHAVECRRCRSSSMSWTLSHTHVGEWQTIAPDMWPPNSPDLNPGGLWWKFPYEHRLIEILRELYDNFAYERCPSSQCSNRIGHDFLALIVLKSLEIICFCHLSINCEYHCVILFNNLAE